MARSAADLARPVAIGYRWLAVVATCLVMAGCGGVEPMDLPDEREDPAFPGLFTGEEGAWVIYRKER
jgi:hypothetical protein